MGGDWSEFLQCSYHEIDVFEVRVDGQTRQPHCERVECPVPLSGFHIAIQSEGIARDQYVVLHGQSALDRVRLELGVDLDCLEGNFRVLRGREWDTDRS